MAEPARQPGRSTVAVHGGSDHRGPGSPVAQALVQSVNYVQGFGTADLLYTRYGNNPNQVSLARKYALLEGAEDAVFVGSGMAATALAHLAVLRPGDHFLSSKLIYGGTLRLFDEEFARFLVRELQTA